MRAIHPRQQIVAGGTFIQGKKLNEKLETKRKPSRIGTGFRVLGWTLDTTASAITGVWGAVKKVVWIVLVVGLLATNIATLASASFLAAASSAFEGVTGLAAGVTQSARRAATLEADLVKEKAMTRRLTQTLNKNVVALNKAAGSLKQTGAALQKTGSTLKVTRAQIKAQEAALKSVNARALAKSKSVKVITSKITRRAVASASLNLDSLVAQAAPMVGVAVIVGVTTWDLSASCATMQDMHELEKIFDPDVAAVPDQTRVCGMQVPTKEELWTRVASAGAWVGGVSSDAVDFVKNNMPDLPSPNWSGLTMPQMPSVTLPSLDYFNAKTTQVE